MNGEPNHIFGRLKHRGKHVSLGAQGAIGSQDGTQAMSRRSLLQAIGPGLLLAGAAIGGSHLVSSTQAGARYGWALLGLVLLVNLFKYPFFLYAQRYTAATGESLLHGFRRMGMPYLAAFFALSLVTAFLNIAGVAMITASLSLNLGLGILGLPLAELTLLMAAICAAIILIGRYSVLDHLTKVVIAVLAVSTLAAVFLAWLHPLTPVAGFTESSPWNLASLGFIILLMGWMPAPIDISIWSSLWMRAREEQTGHKARMNEVMVDFHLGYLASVVLAVVFLALGALLIHGSGREFSMASASFTTQLIQVYTDAIGPWSHWIITVAAFTAMFSTTLTCMDGWPRSLATCLVLFRGPESPRLFRRAQVGWILLSVLLAYLIIKFFLQNLGQMLEVAMVISFLTSPVFAYINYRAITAPWVPEQYRPGPWLRALSWAGMAFFIGFTLVFLWWFQFQK